VAARGCQGGLCCLSLLPWSSEACHCPRVLQMGACCSSPDDKYDSGNQGPAASGGSHRSKHHHSSGGGAAGKSKTPDFGLGESFEVRRHTPPAARIHSHTAATRIQLQPHGSKHQECDADAMLLWAVLGTCQQLWAITAMLHDSQSHAIFTCISLHCCIGVSHTCQVIRSACHSSPTKHTPQQMLAPVWQTLPQAVPRQLLQSTQQENSLGTLCPSTFATVPASSSALSALRPTHGKLIDMPTACCTAPGAASAGDRW
jgi:hypothetical protein